MTDARTFWNQYYADKDFENEKPNECLVRMMSHLQKGKVLDLAMGIGVNAIYLAKAGFQVEGFDVSDVAVDKAMACALREEVQIEAIRTDLDMYLMPLMRYDSIVMLNFKPQLKRFYGELFRGLKQGGTLLVSSYGTDEMQEAIGKQDIYKDYYFHSNELLRHLSGLKILFYQELEVDGRHVVQCLAQKPFDKDALKYKLFDMHSENGSEPKKSKHLELAEQLFKK